MRLFISFQETVHSEIYTFIALLLNRQETNLFAERTFLTPFMYVLNNTIIINIGVCFIQLKLDITTLLCVFKTF